MAKRWGRWKVVGRAKFLLFGLCGTASYGFGGKVLHLRSPGPAVAGLLTAANELSQQLGLGLDFNVVSVAYFPDAGSAIGLHVDEDPLCLSPLKPVLSVSAGSSYSFQLGPRSHRLHPYQWLLFSGATAHAVRPERPGRVSFTFRQWTLQPPPRSRGGRSR
jgi:alkylated DNA repair dioxygenase AlkB